MARELRERSRPKGNIAMKLDRSASLSPSIVTACCAFVAFAAASGCMVDPNERYCERHPDDPACSDVTNVYRNHGGNSGSTSGSGSHSGKGGCAGAAGGAGGHAGSGGGVGGSIGGN